MKLTTTIKRPAARDSTRYVDRYLNELIDFGGETMTRGKAVAAMQSTGAPQGCIDRWLQGQEHAAERRRRREKMQLRVLVSD